VTHEETDLERRLRAFAPELPAGLVDDVMRQIEGTRQRPTPVRMLLPAVAGIATALVALLVLAGPLRVTGPSTQATKIPAAAANSAVASASQEASSTPGEQIVVASGSNIRPLGWSPDGSLLAVLEEGADSVTIHVFDGQFREVWSHSGREAAWVGSRTLAILVGDVANPSQAYLAVASLPEGSIHQAEGKYLGQLLPASTGQYAVHVGTSVPTAFVLENPYGGEHLGVALGWNSDGTWLAVGLPIAGMSTMGSPTILAFLNPTTGEIRRTDVQVSAFGAVFDRTGHEVLACVYTEPDVGCRPALINFQSGAVEAVSSMRDDLSNADQLPDGRWVGDNAIEGAVLWDPADPTRTVSLGAGTAVVSPTGVVALVVGGGPSSGIQVGPGGIPTITADGVGPSPAIWSPDGSLLAYSTARNGQLSVVVQHVY